MPTRAARRSFADLERHPEYFSHALLGAPRHLLAGAHARHDDGEVIGFQAREPARR